MHNLQVSIELKGEDVVVGEISGAYFSDARFGYARDYLEREDSRAISLSLPLRSCPFSAAETRNFFDGLLPEGFMRATISKAISAPEEDYISVLELLGAECLGAIKISREGEEGERPSYQKMTNEQVLELACEGASKSVSVVLDSHISLTGASGKVGLYYDSANGAWFQPFGTAPSTHIVKQSHVRFEQIVANEMLCLSCAKKLGLDVPETFIVDINCKDDVELLATQRYDRKFSEASKVIDGLKAPFRLHQEDFAQALGIPASQKYESEGENYIELMFDVLRLNSANPIEDQLKLWSTCVFNCLIGNTDNHIKNASLLYDESLSACRLAPVYDIVSTAIYKKKDSKMSMNIGGVYDLKKVTRDSFEQEAEKIGLGTGIALARLDEMVDKFEAALFESAKELQEAGVENAMKLAHSITNTPASFGKIKQAKIY